MVILVHRAMLVVELCNMFDLVAPHFDEHLDRWTHRNYRNKLTNTLDQIVHNGDRESMKGHVIYDLDCKTDHRCVVVELPGRDSIKIKGKQKRITGKGWRILDKDKQIFNDNLRKKLSTCS